MLGYLLASVALVGGLVWKAIDKATSPSTKPAHERAKLARLKLRRVLTLDEAEDGKVLARRYGDEIAEKRFGDEVAKLRTKRSPI